MHSACCVEHSQTPPEALLSACNCGYRLADNWATHLESWPAAFLHNMSKSRDFSSLPLSVWKWGLSRSDVVPGLRCLLSHYFMYVNSCYVNWGGGSVGKVLARHHGNLSWISIIRVKGQAWLYTLVILVLGGGDTWIPVAYWIINFD